MPPKEFDCTIYENSVCGKKSIIKLTQQHSNTINVFANDKTTFGRNFVCKFLFNNSTTTTIDLNIKYL